METSNTELIKDYVQRGEAIAFLLKVWVDAELQEEKLATVTLSNEPMLLETYIAYLHKEHLAPCAQAFLNFVESYREQHPG
jgi:DNA-binding transcriptional LysR family regulator